MAGNHPARGYTDGFAQQLFTGWRPQSFDDLQAEDFAEIAGLPVEIVLLGTGDKLRFPHPKLTRALMEKRIGLLVGRETAALVGGDGVQLHGVGARVPDPIEQVVVGVEVVGVGGGVGPRN